MHPFGMRMYENVVNFQFDKASDLHPGGQTLCADPIANPTPHSAYSHGSSRKRSAKKIKKDETFRKKQRNEQTNLGWHTRIGSMHSQQHSLFVAGMAAIAATQ